MQDLFHCLPVVIVSVSEAGRVPVRAHHHQPVARRAVLPPGQHRDHVEPVRHLAGVPELRQAVEVWQSTELLTICLNWAGWKTWVPVRRPSLPSLRRMNLPTLSARLELRSLWRGRVRLFSSRSRNSDLNTVFTHSFPVESVLTCLPVQGPPRQARPVAPAAAGARARTAGPAGPRPPICSGHSNSITVFIFFLF